MREHRIDLLRFIGLALIILAHVWPPALIFNLRNFDVPLMVLVSAMSFSLAYKQEALGPYVWKRIKRLLLPVWLFLLCYFLYKTQLSAEDFDTSKMLPSFLLLQQGSIGYVWIIRVFLLVALIAPLIYSFNRRISSDRSFFILCAFAFIVYELARYQFRAYFYSGWTAYVSDLLFYIIPYGLLFAIGLRFMALSQSARLALSFISLLVFSAVALYLWRASGAYVATQAFKYPPSFYYFSYALVVLCLIWPVAGSLWRFCEQVRIAPALSFVSANSIWVYLWHICWLQMPWQIEHYAWRWLVVLLLSSLSAFAQVSLVNYLAQRSQPGAARWLRSLLTG
ncbi:acyltransferase family protein [Agaribacterium haliotis]|uniref:acyltransferase family protein n=1 Tax=Agaribacterium haliotis TaxID=2013869 RepID=UPI000BB532A9|nr:acyltransferase family protein [Agaribacterium haliotis]